MDLPISVHSGLVNDRQVNIELIFDGGERVIFLSGQDVLELFVYVARRSRTYRVTLGIQEGLFHSEMESPDLLLHIFW